MVAAQGVARGRQQVPLVTTTRPTPSRGASRGAPGLKKILGKAPRNCPPGGGDSLGLAEEACGPCAPMGAALAAVADAAAGAAVSRKLRRWSGLLEALHRRRFLSSLLLPILLLLSSPRFPLTIRLLRTSA